MKQPQIHAEVIKAWADGAEIQLYWEDQWHDIHHPAWKRDKKYRVKPEKKKDIVKYANLNKYEMDTMTGGRWPGDNVKITWDGETGKLKSVEVIE